jgi:hypothetical protein
MKLIPSRRFAFVIVLVLFGLLLIVPTIAWAQSGATQRLTGRVNPGENIYYRLSNLERGNNLYVLVQSTSGNLDPFVGTLDAQTDLDAFHDDFSQDLEATLNNENILQAVNAIYDQYFLAWDDDGGPGYTAALTYSVPKDGNYYLVVSSSFTNAWETFGDYRLSLGIDVPAVLSGSTSDTAVIAVRDFQASLEKVGVEVITGTLSAENLNKEYRISPKNPGDKLTLFLEDVSGDLTASMFLMEYGGKVVAIAVP